MGDKNDEYNNGYTNEYNNEYNNEYINELIKEENNINNMMKVRDTDKEFREWYTNFTKYMLGLPSSFDENKEIPECKPECEKSEILPLYNREEYYNKNSQAYRDLRLVMSQTDTEEKKAIDALMRNYGDIVNAIMDLTM